MIDFIKKSKVGVFIRALKSEPLSLIYKNVITYIKGKSKVNNKEIAYQKLIDKEAHRSEQWVAKKHQNSPLISIVVPVFNTNHDLLRQCIESVIQQTYQNWELCLYDDGSDETKTLEVLKTYENQDRITIHHGARNCGITEATNQAIKITQGKYVAFLDHDDLLRLDALDCMVNHINLDNEPDVLYSDEDKLDMQNNRSNPHFKTDWNYDLLLAQNYINHLVLVKKEIGSQVGWLTNGTDGVQDHDFLLKCAAITSDFFHVKEVLYHWRMTEGSTAKNSNVKGDLFDRAKAMLERHGRTMGEAFKVEKGLKPLTYAVRREFNLMPLVDIVIPIKDNLELTRNCVNSILNKTDYKNYKITIINNGCEEMQTLRWLEELSDKRIEIIDYNRSFNYSAIVNHGVSQSDSDYVLLLNYATRVINSEWVTSMVEQIVRKEIGAVGAKLLYSDNTIQHAGIVLGVGGVGEHSHEFLDDNAGGYFSRPHLIHEISACSSDCLLIEKSIFNQVNGFEETNLPNSFSDIDFCLKVIQSGYKIIYQPLARLYIEEINSDQSLLGKEKQTGVSKEKAFMDKKWGHLLQDDPNYSPFLSKNRPDFSLVQF